MDGHRNARVVAVLLPVLVLSAVRMFLAPRDPVFPLDDAYIHLTYARNLAGTGTFCFNPGEASLGTSSPLWVLLIAPIYWIGCDVYRAIQVLNLILFLGLCLLVVRVVDRIATGFGFSTPEALSCSSLAGAHLALNGNLHWFAQSGMETMFCLLLSLLAVLAWYRRGLDPVTGTLLGLLVLTRATGIAVAVTCVLFEVARKRYRRTMQGLACMLLVVAPWLWLSTRLTGDWLPTTAKGKLATYVDGGLSWNRIPKGRLHDQGFVQHLIAQGVLEEARLDPGYVMFRGEIRTEGELGERLRQAGVADSQALLPEWRFTHRNHVYWYLRTLLLYQRFQPGNYVLLALVAGLLACSLARGRRAADWTRILSGPGLLPSMLAVWGLLHLGLHALFFRTLLHNTRYLAEEYLILGIIGPSSALLVYRRARAPVIAMAGLCLVLSTGVLPYWRSVCILSASHVNDVYVRMAEWVRRNTGTDARVAAFDIGVLRYLADRYVVDLGGLVDPEAHPCLARKECGEYVRLKGADHIVYPRNPELDYFTGLYLAEYQGPMLLKQAPLAHFETAQYDAPVLLQAFRLDVNRITGWFPPSPASVSRLFSYDDRPYDAVNRLVDDRLEFLGYSIDQREVENIPLYPYAIKVSFFYAARQPLVHTYWVHLAFFDSAGRVQLSFAHIPTHNRLPYGEWALDQEVQEHHLVFVPASLPRGRFRVRLTIGPADRLDGSKLTRYAWYDLGAFENKGNLLKPMDHQQMMCLSPGD